MNIYDIEKIIVENDFDEENFLKFIEKEEIILDDMTIAERISKKYEALEEINNPYEVLDSSILSFLENFKKSDESEFLEDGGTITKKHLGEIFYFALILIKDGINILDAIQEGVVAFSYFCGQVGYDSKKIEKFGRAYMIFGIVNYIKKECIEKEFIFKKYINDEKNNLFPVPKARRIIDKEKAKKFKEERTKLLASQGEQLDMLQKLIEKKFKYQNIPYVINDKEIMLMDHYFGMYSTVKTTSKISKILDIDKSGIDKKIAEIYLKLTLSGESVEL